MNLSSDIGSVCVLITKQECCLLNITFMWTSNILVPAPKRAIALRSANSLGSRWSFESALTYSWTLQMVVVTWRTLEADSFSWDTEVWRWLTIEVSMVARDIDLEHWAIPSTKMSVQQFRNRASWVSYLQEGKNCNIYTSTCCAILSVLPQTHMTFWFSSLTVT